MDNCGRRIKSLTPFVALAAVIAVLSAPGERLDLGGGLVADRPERRDRLYGRRLSRRRRAQDRRRRLDR